MHAIWSWRPVQNKRENPTIIVVERDGPINKMNFWQNVTSANQQKIQAWDKKLTHPITKMHWTQPKGTYGAVWSLLKFRQQKEVHNLCHWHIFKNFWAHCYSRQMCKNNSRSTISRWLCRHSMPLEIVLDQGKEFCKLINYFCLKIKKTMTTPLSPPN
jgi:hypothetical protein